MLTKGFGFGILVERSGEQSSKRTLKIKQRLKKKPLKINLSMYFKYSSNSREERGKMSERHHERLSSKNGLNTA